MDLIVVVHDSATIVEPALRRVARGKHGIALRAEGSTQHGSQAEDDVLHRAESVDGKGGNSKVRRALVTQPSLLIGGASP